MIAALIGIGVLASGLPPSLHGFGFIVVLLLTALDLVLIRSTRGLAFARSASLDERERALRDHAYRIGFRWIGFAMVIVLLVVIFGTVIAAVVFNGAPSPSELQTGLDGRVLFAILEVLCIVPTMVVAWDQAEEADATGLTMVSAHGQRGWLWGLMWLLLPTIAAVWALDVTLVPTQAVGRNLNFTSNQPLRNCREFITGRVVGGPFGATVGLRADVCWNGIDAFVLGDPSDALPSSALTDDEYSGQIQAPGLTQCGADTNDDFASVATTCTATIDAEGTLHYVVKDRVAPLPFSIAARDITLVLVVTRSGTVVTQP